MVVDDYKVGVVRNGERLSYDELSTGVKTAVYVSIILSMPNSDDSDGRWLIFEERINIDRKVLSDMLLNVDNVTYVVDVTREVPATPVD